jgi:hypothetical protein
MAEVTAAYVAALRTTFRANEAWRCQCGKVHTFGVWAAAHWDVVLTHNCDCGLQHDFKSGRVKAIRSKNGTPFTARRENGPHHDQDIAATYDNKWVVRDENGVFIDWDRYRHDLEDRYDRLVIQDEDVAQNKSVEG